MKLDKFPMHYVLEDKITGILFPNVGAHDLYISCELFQIEIESQLFQQFIYVDLLWMCIIANFLKTARYVFQCGFHICTEESVRKQRTNRSAISHSPRICDTSKWDRMKDNE